MDGINAPKSSAFHLRRRGHAPVEESAPLLSGPRNQVGPLQRAASACMDENAALLALRFAPRESAVHYDAGRPALDSLGRSQSHVQLIDDDCLHRYAAAASQLEVEPAPLNATPVPPVARKAPAPQRISLDNDEWAHVALTKVSARDFFESRAVAHELHSGRFESTDPVRAAYHRALAKVLRAAPKNNLTPGESGGYERMAYRHRRRCFALESVFNEMIHERGGLSLLSHILFDTHAFERFLQMGGARRMNEKIESGRERGQTAQPSIEELRPSHKDIAEARPYSTLVS